MRTLTACMILAIALAGCADDSQSPDTGDAPGPAATVDVPEWSVGDHWTLSMSGGGGEPRTADLVVIDRQGGDYIIGTNDPLTAYFDALFGISMMGPQRVSDLAGSQGQDRVQFLQFPLTDGASWTTTWDGNRTTITAAAQADGTFHLTAVAGGVSTATYTYDPELRWMSLWTFGPESADPFVMEVTASGSDYSGEIHSYQLFDIIDIGHTGGGSASGTIEVANHNEWQVAATMNCGQTGHLVGSISPPNDDGSPAPLPADGALNRGAWSHNVACPGGGDSFDVFILPVTPGTWRVDTLSTSQNSVSLFAIQPMNHIIEPFA